MSSLYRLDATASQIAAAMEGEAGRDPWQGDYLAPGKFAPVIVRHQKAGARIMRPMHWGYPPPGWNIEGGMEVGARPRWVSHVRNLTSPFWIGNLRHTELRCLVPATSFQGWGPPISDADRASGKRRVQSWNGVPSQGVFAFAGIWRDLTDMPVFAILSCDSGGVRGDNGTPSMPVILHPEDHDVWLRADWQDAQRVLEAFPAEMVAEAVPPKSAPPIKKD